MLSVRIPETLEHRLNDLSKKTKRSKSHYVEQALNQYLDDYEDYMLALSRLEEKGPNVSLEDAMKELGFSHSV